MQLQTALAEKAYYLGADIFGVADLTRHQQELQEIYGDLLGGFPRAVSVGIFMPHHVIDELLEHPSHTYLAYYETANTLLDQIGLVLNNMLNKAGYDSYPISASQRTGVEKDRSIFSHRLAAHEAGLGWSGKSCNFIHPEVGPRVRLVTVLTDAPLEAGSPMANRCGSCKECANICPVHAIKGFAYDDTCNIEERFDFHKCDDYLTEVRQVFGKRICGRCMAICPYGRKTFRNE